VLLLAIIFTIVKTIHQETYTGDRTDSADCVVFSESSSIHQNVPLTQ